jgi:hypothetical protein
MSIQFLEISLEHTNLNCRVCQLGELSLEVLQVRGALPFCPAGIEGDKTGGIVKENLNITFTVWSRLFEWSPPIRMD